LLQSIRETTKTAEFNYCKQNQKVMMMMMNDDDAVTNCVVKAQNSQSSETVKLTLYKYKT